MKEQQTAHPQTSSPQQRLRELQSIPDNQKTEAQWDEIIELEIALAQGGRRINFSPKPQRHINQMKKYNGKPQGGVGSGVTGGGVRSGLAKKPQRKFYKRPAKPATPQ